MLPASRPGPPGGRQVVASQAPSRAGFDMLLDEQAAIRARALAALVDWPDPLAPAAAAADALQPPPVLFPSIAAYQAALAPLLGEEAHEQARQAFPSGCRRVLPLCTTVAHTADVPGGPLVRLTLALDRQRQEVYEAAAGGGGDGGGSSSGPLQSQQQSQRFRSRMPVERDFVMLGTTETAFNGGGSAVAGIATRSLSDKRFASFDVVVHRDAWSRALAAHPQALAREQAAQERKRQARAVTQARAKQRKADAAAAVAAAAVAAAEAGGDGGAPAPSSLPQKRPRSELTSGTAPVVAVASRSGGHTPAPAAGRGALPPTAAPLASMTALAEAMAKRTAATGKPVSLYPPSSHPRRAPVRAAAAAAAAADDDYDADGDGYGDDDDADGDGHAAAAADDEAAAAADDAGDEDEDDGLSAAAAAPAPAPPSYMTPVPLLPPAAPPSSSSSAAAAAAEPLTWYLWPLASAVTSLREAEALYSLHTYDPGLVRALLQPGVPRELLPSNRQLGITAAAARPLLGGGGDGGDGGGGGSAGTQAQPGILAYLPPSLRSRFFPGPEYQRLYLRAKFNASQQAAIVGAVRTGCVSLIQGPPGTGKTTTIIGLLNTLHLLSCAYYNDVLFGNTSQAVLAAAAAATSAAGAPLDGAARGGSAAASSGAPAAAAASVPPSRSESPAPQPPTAVPAAARPAPAVAAANAADRTGSPLKPEPRTHRGVIVIDDSDDDDDDGGEERKDAGGGGGKNVVQPLLRPTGSTAAAAAVLPGVVVVTAPAGVTPSAAAGAAAAAGGDAAPRAGGNAPSGDPLPGPLLPTAASSAQMRATAAAAAAVVFGTGAGSSAAPTEPARSTLADLLRSAGNFSHTYSSDHSAHASIAAGARLPHTHPAAAALAAVGPPRAIHGVLRWLLSTTNPVEECLQTAAMGIALRPRILVTAPSNTAVDNITLKIVRDGFKSGALVQTAAPAAAGAGTAAAAPRPPQPPQLEVYRPPIVRVGEGALPSVRSCGVHLEAQVDELLGRPLEQLRAWAAKVEADRVAIVADVGRLRAAYHAEVTRVRAALTADAVAKHAAGDGSSAVTGDAPPSALPPAAAAEFAAAFDTAHRELLLRVGRRLLAAVHAHEYARHKAARAEAALAVHSVPDRDRPSQLAAARRSIRSSLLEAAEIVLTTTSSAAVGTVEAFVTDTGHAFDVCVIDEAAQAVEPSSLIPLRYGCSQLVLVGDPQQLPATVLSRPAARAGYDRSLFGRLAEGGAAVTMLNTQYRTHPAISAFPSAYFYGGRLKDDVSVVPVAAAGAASGGSGSVQQLSGGRYNAMHEHPAFRPLVVYNLFNARQSGGGAAGGGTGSTSSSAPAAVSASAATDLAAGRLPKARGGGVPAAAAANGGGGGGLSSSNEDEAAFVVRLLRALHAWRGVDARTGARHKFSGSVGVITFYRAQLGLLQRAVDAAFVMKPAAGAAAGGSSASATSSASGTAADGRPTLNFTLDINTVDGFQGQERDVVILSCVRTIEPGAAAAAEAAEAAAAATTAAAAASGGSSNDAARAAGAQPPTLSLIGFLGDPRRLNVALTRARYGCWVVGHAPALSTSPHWRAFLTHAAAAGALVDVADPARDPAWL